ncbi:uncharacterized protein ALTATR162_LOCUS9775 [Alternaria atra]|uniref:Uncharacterized protein n=1 Tax=Alternaria atra TaxID=119953 RepID=A0A8J2ICY2_9PLEO|nr:uncharacterized protein ALTATR162_LOCUS9775 [Alternaria atra]CAG5181463.1 unnamed protein product [Alternaria atra]
MVLFALHYNRKVRICFKDEDAEVGTKYITPVELLHEQTKGTEVNSNNTDYSGVGRKDSDRQVSESMWIPTLT